MDDYHVAASLGISNATRNMHENPKVFQSKRLLEFLAHHLSPWLDHLPARTRSSSLLTDTFEFLFTGMLLSCMQIRSGVS